MDEDQLLDLATLATSMTLTAEVGIERGEAHRAICLRKFRVRWFNSPEGLTIIVTVPARYKVDLEPLECGRRVVPWSDLNRRAHELSNIVDECVLEVERALGLGAARA